MIHDRLERLVQQWRPEASQQVQSHPPPLSSPGTPIPRLNARSWRMLIAIASLAFVIAGWIWWQGRAQPIVQVADRVQASSSASNSVDTAISGPVVVVHVVGAVRKPGLVHLVAGSRVSDALKLAGGATSSKAEGSVNLARVLIDGEQVLVSASGVVAGNTSGGKISLNSGSAQQFEDLPGVGPVLAQRIVDYRTEHGSFRSIDQLDEVSGIGSALMGQLRAHVQM